MLHFSKDLALARDRVYHDLSAKRWDYDLDRGHRPPLMMV
jgi:hypothetical protein